MTEQTSNIQRFTSNLLRLGEIDADVTSLSKTISRSELFYRYAMSHCQSDFVDGRTEAIRVDGGTELLGSNVTSTNDAEVVSATTASRFDLPRQLKCTAGNRNDPSIVEFLGKPAIVRNGVLASTDTATTFIHDFAMSFTNSNAIYADKLEGVFAFRATTVVTLQVNATKFQSGIYILAAVPVGGIRRGVSHWVNFYNMHRANSTAITQLPHVKLDVNCDTQVQLKIPYVSCTTAYRVNTLGTIDPVGESAAFFIYPYAPLAATGGSTTADYTLFIHYEDVELYGESIPQAGDRGYKKAKNKDIQNTEVEDRRVSNALKLATDVASSLSTIPVLSSIAAPASWLLDAAARAAYLWGWSKPPLLEKQCRMFNEPIPFLPNADISDGVTSLSYYSRNHLSIMPGAGGTDLDEMSIDYIKSIPSHFYSTTWNTGTLSGSQITNFNVGPHAFWTGMVDGTVSYAALTPVAFLANLFAYYRGSVNIHVRFAKTQFHSGRLMFAFIPYENYSLAAPTVSMANLQYCQKVIFDLRESSEFCMNLPFTSILPWRETTGTYKDYGALYVYVLDQLVAPANVPSSVQIRYEVSGGKDLEFAVPSATNATTGPNMSPMVPSVLQGGEVETTSDPCTKFTGAPGTMIIEDLDPTFAEFTIGESIRSLRTLCKRGGFVNAFLGGSTTNFICYIVPFAIGLLRSTGTTLNGTNNYDPINLISSCYCFKRGAIRIKATADVVDDSTTVYAMLNTSNQGVTNRPGFQQWLPTATLTFAQFIYDSAGSAITFIRQNAGGLNVQVPHYNMMAVTPIACMQYTDVSTVAMAGVFAEKHTLKIYIKGTTPNPMHLYRSGGDDFSLHLFTSVPPMVMSTRQ